MIIRTDITAITARRPPVSERTAAPRAPKIDREPDHETRHTVNRRMEMERSLGDALSIAQMSQNLIQRVINISLRLKNISSGAIATGKVNTRELSEALTTVKNALGDYGETITNPVQSNAAPSSKIPELPDISGDIRKFREIAAEMKDGNYRQTERLDALTSGLNQKSGQVAAAETVITGRMKNTAAYSSPHTESDANELITRVRSAMESNPGAALYLQGNIRHGAAGKIFS